ncbi:MAG: DUF2779 domain-containing protein [Gammaproteobacteria bacterium]
MHLTKTRILAGLQCEKRLHLALHRPEEAQPVISAAAITGQVVERHARLMFPGAVLIERGATGTDPFRQTAQCLQDPAVQTLFEAAFRDDPVTVFVDVLQRAGAGWDLIEIKAGTRVEDRHIDDVAIQVWVLSRTGINLNRIYLMHIDSAFIYHGGHDYAGLFVREDITERVQRHLATIGADIERLQNIAAGPEPVRHVGGHCKRPWICEFTAYCNARDAGYPVSLLPNVRAQLVEQLLARGVTDVRNIPADALSSETHQRIRRITIAGSEEQLPGAASELDALAWPRYYLDFECIQFAVPVWAGTHPYDQLPFQWSCHIEYAAQPIVHREFLDTSGTDPRRAFAETLLAVCGEAGAIIVYNQSFEKRIISELAAAFADLRESLRTLNDRIVDLLPVVKRNYYHPDMKGSWSIKSVLPCLVPGLRYADLGAVQEGTRAQQAYFDLISGELNAAAAERLHKDLLAYCRLDTWAMVAMVEKLQNKRDQ